MKSTLRKAVMLDAHEHTAINRARATLGKAKPSPSAQSVADETAARLRTAAQRGNPNPGITYAGQRLPGSEIVNFVGSRREITLESLAYPALAGQRRGTPASGPQDLLDEKMAAKAARIARRALDPHASPADRQEAAKWCRDYIAKVNKVAAIKAAGRVLAWGEA